MALVTSFTNNETLLSQKIGYKNGDRIIVEAIYDEGVSSFGSESYGHKPFGTVCKNSCCGLIDETGRVVVPLEYQEVCYLFKDLVAVRKENEQDKNDWSYGVINLRGDVIIPFDYKHIVAKGDYICCLKYAKSKRYSNYRILVVDDRAYDYFKEEGEVWFNDKGELLHKGKGAWEDGCYLITEIDGKLGLIDTGGRVVLKHLYDEIHCPSDTRFIVRKEVENSWRFGVLNEKGETIVPFKFKYISPYKESFFECYTDCNSSNNDCNNLIRRYSYSEESGAVWFNHDGIVVYKGHAKFLSPSFLGVEKGGLWGVCDQKTSRIINFLYDDVSTISDYIVVVKDERIGLIGRNGELIITPSYDIIECVSMENRKVEGPIIGYNSSNWVSRTFGNYNLEHIFDTNNPSNLLRRKCIYYRESYGRKQILFEYKDDFDWAKPFILSNNEYAELFTMKDGILSESKAESIEQITEKCYAIKRAGKWGVFRIDTKELVIPCDFERIRFEGGHVALIYKENKWGAKTLLPSSHLFYLLAQTNIPVEFQEIKILDEAQSLFGVKREQLSLDGEIRVGYTILLANGEQPEGMKNISDTDSQFEYYSWDRILSSRYNKWGFISLYGFESIPFKYDFIGKRDDGNFDVRIEERWGVINLSGKEIVAVKYREQIPPIIKDAIVFDYDSECCGILSEDGAELIPAIYEHLIINGDVIFFGNGGYEGNNFFSDIDNATWGCLDRNGVIIIPPKYDCFSIRDGFIFAGRDGSMVGDTNQDYNDKYTGVYDMFSMDGQLVIGGFNECHMEDGLFFFLLNGKWETYYWRESWNDYNDYGWRLVKEQATWLVLDKNLHSVKRGKNNLRVNFKKGFIFKITQKKEGDKTTTYYNFDIQVLTNHKPYVSGNYLINNNKNKSQAIRLSDGMTSDYYDKIQHINDDLFYARRNNLVGIVSFDNKVLLPLEFFALTYIVGNYLFAFKNINDKKCSVSLVTINGGCISSRVVINERDYKDVIDDIRYGMFRISLLPNATDLKSIGVYRPSIFDQEFASEIDQNSHGNIINKFKYLSYWFSNSSDLEKQEEPEDYYTENNNDWSLSDTWDAMTDGMYGDMPDGFDGDFSFLGR